MDDFNRNLETVGRCAAGILFIARVAVALFNLIKRKEKDG